MQVSTREQPLTVRLDGGRSYPIHFRPLADLPELLDAARLRRGRCLIVTDEEVGARYGDPLVAALGEAGWAPRLVTLPAGEATKSAAQLGVLYDEALGWGIDRQTPLLALGGGVIGDLAGYAAATLLRGLPFVQLPTTLIAQVDSAIGGKTGINHATGKNLIGAFHQPAFVCADLQTLSTLPEREYTSGLAEVVKHALIDDVALFETLESRWEAIMARTPDVIGPVVRQAARVKTEVVSADEREAGRRAILNFGHTFGHAIERTAGYGTFTHGEAVALGMLAALHLSHRLHADLPLERAAGLVQRIPVPSGLSALSPDELTGAMQSDKKALAGTVRFVVLRRLGEAYVTSEVSATDVEEAWTYSMQYS